jgi:hypothetical protein
VNRPSPGARQKHMRSCLADAEHSRLGCTLKRENTGECACGVDCALEAADAGAVTATEADTTPHITGSDAGACSINFGSGASTIAGAFKKESVQLLTRQ